MRTAALARESLYRPDARAVTLDRIVRQSCLKTSTLVATMLLSVRRWTAIGSVAGFAPANAMTLTQHVVINDCGLPVFGTVAKLSV